MRHAQLLAYNLAPPLLDSLRLLAQAGSIWLREVRDPKACLNLLLEAGAGVLVLHLGRDLEDDCNLLEQTTRLLPEIPAVVVLDAPHPNLAALAWDLGAAYVVPPQTPERVLEIVQALLQPAK
ncbi:MAG: hypothetical protein U0793_18245 [Gemmataceae bacterium]